VTETASAQYGDFK